MILYGAPNPAPNPRRVRIFLAEKGIDLPETRIDMMKREHKSAEFRAKNPMGQIPTLELDDGTCISETVSICRYLEALHPDKPLFGTTALEQAQIDMWIRRVEFQLMTPVGMFWRHAHPLTAALLTQFKDFGESNRDLYARACSVWIAIWATAGRTWPATPSPWLISPR
jgi:glutathione S-transferase